MSYIVTWTGQAGDSLVYRPAVIHDLVVKTPEAGATRAKVISDTSRVRTLLATPI